MIRDTLIKVGWALWGGLPLGLGLTRLLFEADPLSFTPLGAPVPAVLIGVLAAAAAAAFLILYEREAGEAMPGWVLLPGGLAWIYVLGGALSLDVLRGAALVGGGLVLTIALAAHQAGERLPPEVTAAGAAALAYLITLQRTIGRADTFEFQVTAPVLGVVHPTGYPLYTLLGKLYSLLPLGSVAARVNLTSAAAGVLVAFSTAYLLHRVLKVRAGLAVVGALAFALSPTFWSQAVIAEVYAFHLAFVVALLILALSGVVEGELSAAQIMVGGALVGLSLTNHLTTVLVLPAVGLALVLVWPRLPLRTWLIAAGLLLGALLLYLYIPLRWPALHDGAAMPFGDFIAWVTGQRFSGALQLRAWLTDAERWRIMGRLIADQYGLAGVVLGVVGLAAMAVQQWRAALVMVIAYAGVLFYGLNYVIADVHVFVIPLHLLLAVWIAYGVEQAATILGERSGQQAVPAAMVAALALIPLSLVWRVGPTLDWADERALEAWGRYVLSLPLDENAIILADGEKIAPLEYLSRIEGVRDDISMAVHGIEEEYVATLFASLEAGQTVYLARFLPGLEGSFHLRSVGPLVEVGTEPVTDPPADMQSATALWENGMVLLGYTLDRDLARPGDTLNLTLYWRAQEPIEGSYHVRVGLFDQSGLTIEEGEAAFPVGGRYPPAAWKQGEIIADHHAVEVPYSVLPGDNRIAVSVIPPFSDEPVQTIGGRSSEVVTEVFVAINARQRVPPVGERRAIVYEGGSLLSFDAPQTLPDGAAATVEMTRFDTSGGYASDYRLPNPVDVDLPIGLLNPQVRLFLTSEAAGEAEIVWGFTGVPMRCGWLRGFSDGCELGRTRIIEGGQSVANFDGLIALEEVDFATGEIQPGDTLDVTLMWRGLRAIPEDYTVSVQLIGPDGRLYAQSDAFPVQGTFPTSSLEPGQTITDRHTVRLAEDAPPGDYELRVALYLLSTNTRLPVLGESGQPIGDNVALEGLVVSEQ